jgi:hypothetical protein
MELSIEKRDQINKLVDELTKDKPNLQVVKSSMENLGLKYTEDPVERLNTVLMSLHPQINETEAMKDL